MLPILTGFIEEILVLAPAHAAPPAPCSLLTTTVVEQVVGKLNGSPKADQEVTASSLMVRPRGVNEPEKKEEPSTRNEKKPK
jgi:hypothetical protein